MDCSLTENDRKLYRVWLHSPSVYGSEVETILAFKIAAEIQGVPSRVLRVLKGVPGQDPEVVRSVEAFVAADPSLRFVEDGEARRIAIVE